MTIIRQRWLIYNKPLIILKHLTFRIFIQNLPISLRFLECGWMHKDRKCLCVRFMGLRTRKAFISYSGVMFTCHWVSHLILRIIRKSYYPTNLLSARGRNSIPICYVRIINRKIVSSKPGIPHSENHE